MKHFPAYRQCLKILVYIIINIISFIVIFSILLQEYINFKDKVCELVTIVPTHQENWGKTVNNRLPLSNSQ